MKRLQHDRSRPLVIAGLFLSHLSLHVVLGARGIIDPLEYFNLLLLGANAVVAVVLLLSRRDILVGGGLMFLIGAHAFLGQRLAPDPLTSGALLMANILILYVGVKVYTHLPRTHWYCFVASYLTLFFIFNILMDNAEALFLLSLMALAACARSLRLMAYFWTLATAFTVCQPYAWEALFIFWFTLTAVFTSRGRLPSKTAAIFLSIGLVLLFLVLLPVIILLFGEDMHNIELVLRDVRVRSAIVRTFWTASASTLILAVFCIPLGYALSRLRFRGRALLLSCVDIPIVIPQSVAGIMLIRVFGRQQILGELFQSTFGIPIDGTTLGIILAQIFVAMPFLLKSVIGAFDAVPETLEIASRTLGASSWGAFRRVALPLASRGIFLGAVLAWARAAGEFGALVIIAPTPETAPIAAYNRFNAVGVVEAAPLVAALLLFSLVMFFLLQFASRALPTVHGRQA